MRGRRGKLNQCMTVMRFSSSGNGRKLEEAAGVLRVGL